ncbi:hypothetical protein [Achromobacter piechaudii]|uniref:hypothetical protein n=1 Tax=Achromobacter piechaudii TaxID=72556 RepID=UPI003DA80D02
MSDSEIDPKRGRWKTVAAFTVGTAVTFVVAWFLSAKFADLDGMASWVQGIGSILAIVGAVWAVTAQERASLKAIRVGMELADARQHRAVLAVSEAALHRVELVVAAISNASDWRVRLAGVYVRTIFDGFSAALNAIPVHQLPSRDAVNALLMLQQHLVFFATNADQLVDGPWKHQALQPVLEQYRENYERSRDLEDQKALLDLVEQANSSLKKNVELQANLVQGYVDALRSELESLKRYRE